MIKPSTNSTFCYVEFCQTLSPYEAVTFQIRSFPFACTFDCQPFLIQPCQNSNSDSSIHLARYSSTRPKTYFSPLCSLNLSYDMVFPNKYSTHTSKFQKCPQYSFCKRRQGDLKKMKKRGSTRVIKKKNSGPPCLQCLNGIIHPKNKELHLRPYLISKLET